jgi:hypothetical protein
MFRWLWLFVPVVLAGPGCAKLNSDFTAASEGEGGSDATTAGLGTTSSASASDTKGSADSGLWTTEGTDGSDSTEGHGGSTEGHDDSTTHDTMNSTVGTDGSTGHGQTGTTGDPSCPIVHDPCDAFAEETCDEGICRPFGYDGEFVGVACVEQAGAGQPLSIGDSCAHACGDAWGEDGCPARSVCDPFSDNPTCIPLCSGDFPDYNCEVGTTCEVHDTPAGSFGLCRAECDLLLQDCPKGQTCIPGDINGTPSCVPVAGEGEQDDPCKFVNVCAPGFVCIPDEFVDCGSGGGCCTAICDLEEVDELCDGGLSCEPLVDGAGACQVPG